MRRDRAGFLAAVVFQLVCLALVPAGRLGAWMGGEAITLQTAPIDPYDVLAGYFVTLHYDVERGARSQLEGLEDGPVWLVLAQAEPAWQLSKIDDAPLEAGPDEVVLRGRLRHGNLRLRQISRFYVPEVERAEVESALRETETPPLVDLRVGSDGSALVLGLRVGDRRFGDGR